MVVTGSMAMETRRGTGCLGDEKAREQRQALLLTPETSCI